MTICCIHLIYNEQFQHYYHIIYTGYFVTFYQFLLGHNSFLWHYFVLQLKRHSVILCTIFWIFIWSIHSHVFLPIFCFLDCLIVVFLFVSKLFLLILLLLAALITLSLLFLSSYCILQVLELLYPCNLPYWWVLFLFFLLHNYNKYHLLGVRPCVSISISLYYGPYVSLSPYPF